MPGCKFNIRMVKSGKVIYKKDGLENQFDFDMFQYDMSICSDGELFHNDLDNYDEPFDNEERYYDNLNDSCKTCYCNINGFCEAKGVDINSVKESVSECWSYRNGITLRAVSDFQDDYEDNIDNFY